jgi:hypothetical protein
MTEENTTEEVTQYTCDGCGWVSDDEDNFRITDSDLSRLCEDCYAWCERCETVFHSEDRSRVNDDIWCRDCADNYSFYCDGCDERYDSDSVDSYYIYDGRCYRCQFCVDNNFNWCENCENHYEDTCACGDSVIHNYGFKPEPIFHGTDRNGLYFGIELETEIHRSKSNAALKAQDMFNDFYLKNDSSISANGEDGFEIVTHPATHDYFRNDFHNFWNYVEDIRANDQARSWDTKTCGLHIHISRKGFSSGAHTHRFLAFIYRNAENMVKFAGRSSAKYASFADCWKFTDYAKPYLSFTDKVIDGRNTMRMSAVNTTNRDTIELRFFRGTMRKSGILGAIDLAHACVEYTRYLTVSDVRYGAYNWEWFSDWVRDQNSMFGIYSDLLDRMAKCPSVNVNNVPKIEA